MELQTDLDELDMEREYRLADYYEQLEEKQLGQEDME